MVWDRASINICGKNEKKGGVREQGKEGWEGEVGHGNSKGLLSVKEPHIFPVTVFFFYYLNCFRKRGKVSVWERG